MKLRNKKTGEIGEFFCSGDPCMWEITLGVELKNEETVKYNSLSKMAEEWEDYEEPKEHWCITMYGGITRIKDNEEPIDDLIEIGNYFNSKEDAYDALDKLKALKRLKDKGLEVTEWVASLGDDNYKIGEVMVGFDIDGVYDGDVPDDIEKDLDILFGGEE